MTQTITQQDVAYGIAYAVIVGASVGALTSLQHRWKSAKFRHNYCSALLVCVVVAEFYYVSLVAVKLTPNTVESVLRSECRASFKGGKIPGTFRDCSQGQGAVCSRETPCTPCDYPTAPFEFDGALWDSACSKCSLTSFDRCPFSDRHGPFCLQNTTGTVEPCKACCSDAVFTLRKSGLNYTSNLCEQVYEEEFFPNASKQVTCKSNSTFPIKTRFGCCPESSARGDDDYVFLGNADQRLPACLFHGPQGASWEICGDNLGCPIYSNGLFVRDYCIHN